MIKAAREIEVVRIVEGKIVIKIKRQIRSTVVGQLPFVLLWRVNPAHFVAEVDLEVDVDVDLTELLLLLVAVEESFEEVVVAFVVEPAVVLVAAGLWLVMTTESKTGGGTLYGEGVTYAVVELYVGL